MGTTQKNDAVEGLTIAEATQRIEELQRELWFLLWHRKRLMAKARWADPAKRATMTAAMRAAWATRKVLRFGSVEVNEDADRL